MARPPDFIPLCVLFVHDEELIIQSQTYHSEYTTQRIDVFIYNTFIYITTYFFLKRMLIKGAKRLKPCMLYFSGRNTHLFSEVFEKIVSNRYAETKFSNRPIHNDIIKTIISAAQKAPSSFNFQPYKIILVQSKDMREVLAANAILGNWNASKVKDAPLTTVFVSDKGMTI